MSSVDRSQFPSRALFGLIARVFVYAILLALIAAGMLWGAVEYGPLFYDETGPVEILESVFALVTALIFLFAGRLDCRRASFVSLLAMVLFCAVIRESDYFLDELVGRHTWKILVGLVVVFIIFHIRRNLKSILDSLMDFISQPSFGVFMSGVLVLLVFSRLFGCGFFWKELIKGEYYYVIKTIAEESVEQMGYFLMLVASCEYLILVRVGVRRREETAV